MKKSLALAMGLFAVAGLAHADLAKPGLSWDQLKKACESPNAFQRQNAPTNIAVSCSDQRTVWVPAESGKIELDLSNNVKASVNSDKYTVAESEMGYDVGVSQQACPKFKEVLESIAFNVAVTCDEIRSFKGTATDFCREKATTERQKGFDKAETGRQKAFCGEEESPRQQRPGGKKSS